MVCGGEFLKVVVVYMPSSPGEEPEGRFFRTVLISSGVIGDISKGSMLAWIETGITCSIHDGNDE